MPDTQIRPAAPRFTEDDADRAYQEWGCNCGPGALAAITGMTPDEVRPHIPGFDAKRYTNPSMMEKALRSIGRPWRCAGALPWPAYGLVRIQWEGPWTLPDVPIVARYGYTHWIGAATTSTGIVGLDQVDVFDINCMNNGTGWVSLGDWKDFVAPYLTKEIPRANGKWHITHAIEVERL